ncbi:MAG: hypothetical protein U0527_11380 [Candidatus Eisenbacteria bacterium]
MVPVLVLFVVLPLARLAVPPGADMAMHAALARGLLNDGGTLSPAWGSVTVPLYPRGFSALIALLSLPFGMARAALIASGLAYAVYLVGARQLLLHVTDERRAQAAALLSLLVAKAPQRFYGFGANPTALAIGLAMLGMGATLVRPGDGTKRRALSSSLLLLGAVATHPIGAAVGVVAGAAISLSVSRRRQHIWIRGLSASLLPACALLALLSRFGPRLSEREAVWIVDYQRAQESVLRGPEWAFPISIVTALPRAAGDLFTLLFTLAALLALRTAEGRGRLLRAWLALVLIGATLVVGGKLPGGKLLMYQDRFVPAMVMAVLPLVIHVATDRLRRFPRAEFVLALLLFALGTFRHFDWVQKQLPIATRADLRMLERIEQQVPAGATIDGAYGDATQWVPAIAGRAVTRPHTHISLEDEVRAALEGKQATYWLVGERLRYPPAGDPPPPDARPIHREGRAVLYFRPE